MKKGDIKQEKSLRIDEETHTKFKVGAAKRAISIKAYSEFAVSFAEEVVGAFELYIDALKRDGGYEDDIPGLKHAIEYLKTSQDVDSDIATLADE